MEGGVGVRNSDLKNVEQRSDLVGKWNHSVSTHISCPHWKLKLSDRLECYKSDVKMLAAIV